MSTFVFFNTLRLTYHKTYFLRVGFYSTQAQPIHELNKKIGKVVKIAIIGAPNCGKSTLINNIVERKICAASNKVHTTTRLARAMCFYNDTHIIFLDTPGVVTDVEQKKYNLPDSMLGACYKSLRCADVIGAVHDVSNRWTKDSLHPDVINMLETVKDIPCFLILNKVDKLKSKEQLLFMIKNLTNGSIAGKRIPGARKDKDNDKDKKKTIRGYSQFSDVFLVSALNGDGVQDIKEYLVNNAKTAGFQYSPDKWSDQTPELLIEQTVRAKFLDFLPQEIPYNLKTRVEYYDDQGENIVCSVCVECPTERLVRLIGGAGGGRLQQIKTNVRNDLCDLFKNTVVIDIQLKVKNKLNLVTCS